MTTSVSTTGAAVAIRPTFSDSVPLALASGLGIANSFYERLDPRPVHLLVDQVVIIASEISQAAENRTRLPKIRQSCHQTQNLIAKLTVNGCKLHMAILHILCREKDP